MPLLTNKTIFFDGVGEGDNNIDVDDRGFNRRQSRVNRCPMAEDGNVTKNQQINENAADSCNWPQNGCGYDRSEIHKSIDVR